MSDMIAFAKQLLSMKNILRDKNYEEFKIIYSYAIVSLLQLTGQTNTVSDTDVATSIERAEIQLKKQREAPRFDLQIFEENIFRVLRVSNRESKSKLEREIFFSYGLVGLLISVTVGSDINKSIEDEIKKTKEEWQKCAAQFKQEKANASRKDIEELQRREYLRYLEEYDEDEDRHENQKISYSKSYLSIGKLPESLNADEKELYLYKWYKDTGNDEISPFYRNLVWERNLRFVVSLSLRYSNITCADDLYCIGTDSLYKAIEKFKPSVGVEFATFASRIIINDFLQYRRKLNKESQRVVHLDDVIARDKNGSEQTYGDRLSYEGDNSLDICIRNDELKKLRLVLKELTDRDREIIQLRFLNEPNMTQKEVSDTLKISQSYISRLEKRLMARLRTLIDEAV